MSVYNPYNIYGDERGRGGCWAQKVSSEENDLEPLNDEKELQMQKAKKQQRWRRQFPARYGLFWLWLHELVVNPN